VKWKDQQKKALTKQMQLNYIESELMNYYWHLAEWKRYDDEINRLKEEYNEKLNDPSVGGSIVKMPDGNQENSPWQIEMSGKIYLLEEKKSIEEMYLNRCDEWLSVCTPAQEKMFHQYVMIQQCTDAFKAGQLTGFSENNVKKSRERVLNKIYLNYFSKNVH